jgi:hypothetical protein
MSSIAKKLMMASAGSGAAKYIFAMAYQKMSVIDASDVTSPTIIATVSNSLFNSNNYMAIDYARSILWEVSAGANSLRGRDISDLSSISASPDVTVSSGEDTYGLAIYGDYMYVTTVDGLQVWDISNGISTTSGNKDVELNYSYFWHQAPTMTTGATYTNADGSDQTYLFVSNKFTGANTYLSSYNNTSPSSTYFRSRISDYYEGGSVGRQHFLGWAKDARIIASATYDRDAISWYDASNPLSIPYASHIMSNSSVNKVVDPQMTSDGNYTFCVSDASNNPTFLVINSAGVLTGTTPTITSTINPPSLSGTLESCMLNSSEEYVCISDPGLHTVYIYDVSNPASPSLAGSVSDGTNLDTTGFSIWYEPEQ